MPSIYRVSCWMLLFFFEVQATFDIFENFVINYHYTYPKFSTLFSETATILISQTIQRISQNR